MSWAVLERAAVLEATAFVLLFTTGVTLPPCAPELLFEDAATCLSLAVGLVPALFTEAFVLLLLLLVLPALSVELLPTATDEGAFPILPTELLLEAALFLLVFSVLFVGLVFLTAFEVDGELVLLWLLATTFEG